MFDFVKQDYSALTGRSCSFWKGSFRFFSDAGFRAVCLYRVGHFLRMNEYRIIPAVIQRLILHWCQCTINLNAKIGPGFCIRHVGAVVVGGNTEIGKNCDIRQGVTFGGNMGKMLEGRDQPIVGDNVLIGAGAKILGPVVVGDGALIGANAVVVKDVPDGAVVGGVPAKIIKLSQEGRRSRE